MNSSSGANGKHSFDTEASSGAGEGKVGIAGALAITIADITTNAEIKDNHTRGPPFDKLNGSASHHLRSIRRRLQGQRKGEGRRRRDGRHWRRGCHQHRQ